MRKPITAHTTSNRQYSEVNTKKKPITQALSGFFSFDSETSNEKKTIPVIMLA
jgi:hypothetical protein